MDKLKVDIEKNGKDMYELVRELYPICRSITGDGVRESLKIIGKHIPLKVFEVPSGKKVFDWIVPKEWNIKDAYIKNSKGEKIVDFKKCNLHVLNYSVPINKKVSLEELKEHVFTLPEHPDWIPYVTSYYKENWGFCMSHKQFESLEEDEYEVVIDSSFKEGSLTYGEMFIEGESKEEILVSCYVCHPSMCNDNLSGVALSTFLAKFLLSEKNLKYSYRFLFIPETIGAIAWLSLNEKKVEKIKGGIVATCVGDSGNLTYKMSRKGNSLIDKVMEKVLKDSGEDYSILDFVPTGSDERQFCSPGFDLPVGSLIRTLYGIFPEYHTSADNLDFVQAKYLADSFEKCMKGIFILENDAKYMNLNPKCEPQLGRRGLYRQTGGLKWINTDETAIIWVLNFSDGKNSLLDIAIRSGIEFEKIKGAADALVLKGLLETVEDDNRV